MCSGNSGVVKMSWGCWIEGKVMIVSKATKGEKYKGSMCDGGELTCAGENDGTNTAHSDDVVRAE
jgi:hypothetical protein